MESTLTIRSSLRLATEWHALEGRLVELRYKGIPQHHGRVDAVTNDCSGLWLAANDPDHRTYIDQSSGYEVWVADAKFQSQPNDH